MNRKQLKELEKKTDEYRKWCLDDKNVYPFKTTNAYWAAGYQQFLNWLIENDK